MGANELLSLLRRITEADTAFSYQNEYGSDDAFQCAADELYDSIDAARDWLREHDEHMPPAWLSMNNVD